MTFMLLCREAIGNSELSPGERVDSLAIPMDHRIQQICFDARGLTAQVDANITTQDASAGTGLTTISGAVVPRIVNAKDAFGTPDTTKRSRGRASHIGLSIVTDGTGLAPAGTVAAWVTTVLQGHHTDSEAGHEDGRSGVSGPILGFYDCWSFVNLEAANGDITTLERCNFIAPYTGKIYAAAFHNGASSSGGSTMEVYNKTTSLVAVTGVPLSNGAASVSKDLEDASAIPEPVVTKGDELALRISTGAAITVPIGALTVHLFIAPTGHLQADANDD
jgi:hypothetical protein